MHLSGKILLGFILLFAALGIFMSGRLLKQRNEITGKFESVVKTNATNAENLQKAEAAYAEAVIRSQGASLGWEALWNGVQGNPGFDQARGVFINSNLGTNQGLISRPATDNGADQELSPIVYAFAIDQEGTALGYGGEFRALNLQPQSSTLTPTWRIEAADFQKFRQNSFWRIRSQIPHHLKRRIAELHVRRTEGQVALIDRNIRIQNQTKLQQLSQSELDVRRVELLGNPQAERREDRPEEAIGLNAALEEVEEIRNSLQFDVDDLRRQIRIQSEAQTQLLAELDDLEQGLPQADAQVTQSPRE